MKNLVLLLLFVLVSIPAVSAGITVMDVTNNKQQKDSVINPPSPPEKILLLSWQGDYLRTTAGTVYLKGVRLVEHVKIDKSALDRQNNHLEVRFTRKDNQIQQIDIYPHR